MFYDTVHKGSKDGDSDDFGDDDKGKAKIKHQLFKTPMIE